MTLESARQRDIQHRFLARQKHRSRPAETNPQDECFRRLACRPQEHPVQVKWGEAIVLGKLRQREVRIRMRSGEVDKRLYMSESRIHLPVFQSGFVHQSSGIQAPRS